METKHYIKFIFKFCSYFPEVSLMVPSGDKTIVHDIQKVKPVFFEIHYLNSFYKLKLYIFFFIVTLRFQNLFLNFNSAQVANVDGGNTKVYHTVNHVDPVNVTFVFSKNENLATAASADVNVAIVGENQVFLFCLQLIQI